MDASYYSIDAAQHIHTRLLLVIRVQRFHINNVIEALVVPHIAVQNDKNRLICTARENGIHY